MSSYFVKIQPSNGIIKDEEGKTIALVWIFRPDAAVEIRHWFAIQDTDDGRFVCIETAKDSYKIPINCKLVYLNSDGPSEWKLIDHKKIIECFKFCCDLLLKKYNDTQQQLGNEIIGDAFFGDII